MSRWSYDALIERGRQYSVAGVLLMAAVHDRFVPPFMVLGFLLSVAHLVRHGRGISWSSYWPLYLLPLFYFLSLANIPGSLWEASGEVAPMLRVGYLMAPVILLDLRPTRLWGSALVWGGVGVVLLALLLGVYHSLSLVDGEWVWWPFKDASQAEVLSDPSLYFWSGYSYFFYSGFTFQVGIFPSFMGFTLMMSLIISLHRLLSSGGGGAWLWVSTGILAVGFVLTGSRTMYVCGFLCVTLYAAHLALHRKVAWYVLALGLLGVAVSGYFVLQQPRMRRVLDALRGEHSIELLMRDEQRMSIWYEAYEHRHEYLPWGLGTSRSRVRVKEWMSDHCIPSELPSKMHNELVEALVEQGWVGFGVMGAILVLPLVLLRRFRPVERLLWVPLYVLLTFESMSSIAIGVASLAFTSSILWGVAIWRRRGLGDGRRPFV